MPEPLRSPRVRPALRHQVGAVAGDREASEALGARIEAAAGRELVRGDLEAAAMHLDTAARLFADRPTRRRRLHAAGRAYLSLGDPAAARARLERAYSGRGTEVDAHMLLLEGQATEAQARLEANYEEAGGTGATPAAAVAASHLATLALNRARSDEVNRWARRYGVEGAQAAEAQTSGSGAAAR